MHKKLGLLCVVRSYSCSIFPLLCLLLLVWFLFTLFLSNQFSFAPFVSVSQIQITLVKDLCPFILYPSSHPVISFDLRKVLRKGQIPVTSLIGDRSKLTNCNCIDLFIWLWKLLNDDIVFFSDVMINLVIIVNDQ